MIIKPGQTIGIIGGGQLARMMCFEAYKLGYKVCVFANNDDSPAFDVTDNKIMGDYGDQKLIDKFIDSVSVVTFEFENLPYETLTYIEKKILMRPTSRSLYISQDRIREKSFINKLGVNTTDYQQINNLSDFNRGVEEFNYSALLKTARLGYDGKGQFNINEKSNIAEIYHQALEHNVPLVLEKKVDFVKEISIISARDSNGNIVCYDAVENIHKDGILRKTIAPANIEEHIKNKAKTIAKKIVEGLDYIGILAIEFFLDKDDNLLVNEFAPRPHNSGHYTIDACYHNQFEQAIRAVAGLPVMSTKQHSKAEMINLIGDDILQAETLSDNSLIKIHNYNKKQIKTNRKMGHYTKIPLPEGEVR